MKLNPTLLIAAICCIIFLPAFAPKDRFSHVVKKAIGDLNNDGLSDLVVVTQDTVDNTWPYRLQIFFKQPDGSHKLVLSTEKAIEPRYEDGKDGYRNGNDFDDIQIDSRVLTISVQLLRGHYEHKFRYQNGNFELIGYTSTAADGQGVMYQTDFNLSTGVRIEHEERYDTDKVLSHKKKKVMIRPLPNLQSFQPLQSELY
jgi:hypothetical protein